MPDATADRRKSPRFALILVAAITEVESNARLSAQTSDVSRGGCYVDTLNPIPRGKSVHVLLTHESETFETRGKVIYVSPGMGMGVSFDEPEPSQLAILDRWLVGASSVSP